MKFFVFKCLLFLFSSVVYGQTDDPARTAPAETVRPAAEGDATTYLPEVPGGDINIPGNGTFEDHAGRENEPADVREASGLEEPAAAGQTGDLSVVFSKEPITLRRDAGLRHFGTVENSLSDRMKEFEPLVDDKEFTPSAEEKFHWKPAFAQSMIFLAIQHGSRLVGQPKTRRGLKGPFFKDWGRSIKGLRGWDDGGIWFTNYVAHPLQGGLTGRIFVNNSDRARRDEVGRSKVYWETRFKALVWSALWSAQFELGPISEASIGNVGMTLNKKGKTGMAWVDLVVTPVGGTAVLIAEDAIDKYVLANWLEKGSRSGTMIKFWRTLLTPTTSFANVLRGKYPWYRDNRRY